MPPLGRPLAHTKFNLNSAGVAGFFGGKEAISAMATVHLYRGRRWLGWYNSPGSYTIAKRFGRMANSRFWDGLFPGPNDSPAITFSLDGKQGPQYKAILSGTTMQTGHLGYLTMERSKDTKPKVIAGRETRPVYVSYLAMKEVNYESPVELLPVEKALFAIIPITCSVVACVLSGLVYDWYSFYMILLGIISSGLASYFIGEGKLVLRSVKKPATGSPAGHGILIGEDEVVVIKGDEKDVNAITKGHFDLERCSTQVAGGNADVERDSGQGVVHHYHAIGCSSLLLLVQFLLQLLLIPQASLFGQITFLSSLGVSWAYNSYLSSLEKEKIQANILFGKLGNPQMLRFCAKTRTTMAVFVCLLLFHGVEVSEEKKARELRNKALRSCLPNNTEVWERWFDKVVEQLLHLPESLKDGVGDREKMFPYLKEDDEGQALPEQADRNLLKNLLDDAASAIEEYLASRKDLPRDSSQDQREDGR